MPPEAPPPPGLLQPPGLARWFFRDMCLPTPGLGPPSDAVAGRGHAVGLQWVIKTGRGNVTKKWLRFHALVKLVSDYQRVTDSPVAESRLADNMLNSHPQ